MNISSRSVTLAAILILLISAAGFTADAEGPLYLRQENLQKTLLTTRQQYTAWLTEQPAARAVRRVPPLAGHTAAAVRGRRKTRPAGRSP
jgi:hypothetical protein